MSKQKRHRKDCVTYRQEDGSLFRPYRRESLSGNCCVSHEATLSRQSCPPGCTQKLRQTGDGVMIRKGNSAQLRPKPFRHNPGWGKRAVGEGGMGMQITGIAHGTAPLSVAYCCQIKFFASFPYPNFQFWESQHIPLHPSCRFLFNWLLTELPRGAREEHGLSADARAGVFAGRSAKPKKKRA